MKISIRSPQTEDEWSQYYDLRWRILRQPWQQSKGSEKDDIEDSSEHLAALLHNRIIAVGRIHFSSQTEAQIRYMAVDRKHQSKGIGKLILNALEDIARDREISQVFLHARENAVAFYKKNQYLTIEPSHTLYGEIKHFRMEKTLFS